MSGPVVLISSWVAAGHVGAAAMAPALAALGRATVALPTTVLSNHKAFPAVAGLDVAPRTLRAMAQAAADNGLLEGTTAVVAGYMPSPAHAEAAAAVVETVRRAAPSAAVLCDPVLGDDPRGLYVPQAAAQAVVEALVPLADTLTPNRFELAWLSGAAVDDVAAAVDAARTLPAARVAVTSPPLGAGRTGLLDVGPDAAARFETPLRHGAPHGVGDALTALLAADPDAGLALGRLDALVRASLGRPALALHQRGWVEAAPIPGAPCASSPLRGPSNTMT